MASWTAGDIPDQAGRVVLVTGANSGLGLRSAEALARAGAHVVMGCRNEVKGRAALESVASGATGPAPTLVRLDLADLRSVHACAGEVRDRVGRLDVLMNNAGVMAVPRQRTADGHEMQFGTNHLGHFALTGLLLPMLRASSSGRVVTTSSLAHRTGAIHWDDVDSERSYSKWRAYGQSKLANLLFAFELDRRCRAAGIPVVSAAAHPGYASTHLQEVGPRQSGNPVMLGLMKFGNAVLGQSDEAGARPQLYAATMPDVEGGDYFGPGLPFQMRGSPTRVRARHAAYDLASGHRLWELSEELTGVGYDFGDGSPT
jgi:NAD(P)-dependent dehydrogenase (short-subunit alcohol dehydrogenase family)